MHPELLRQLQIRRARTEGSEERRTEPKKDIHCGFRSDGRSREMLLGSGTLAPCRGITECKLMVGLCDSPVPRSLRLFVCKVGIMTASAS